MKKMTDKEKIEALQEELKKKDEKIQRLEKEKELLFKVSLKNKNREFEE